METVGFFSWLMPLSISTKALSGAWYNYWAPDLPELFIRRAENKLLGNPVDGCVVNNNIRRAGYFEPVAPVHDVITVCPAGFNNAAYQYETTEDSLRANTAQTPDSMLQPLLPKSATLFHELIHATTGASTTHDVCCACSETLVVHGTDDTLDELVDVFQLARRDPNAAATNPASYEWFAMSYFLSSRADGTKYDWSTGRSRPMPLTIIT